MLPSMGYLLLNELTRPEEHQKWSEYSLVSGSPVMISLKETQTEEQD